jgi:hypothetical protein
MNPDPIETILKKARNAQRALLALSLLYPFLFFGLVEVMAYRKAIGSNGFWISFTLLAGITVGLIIWTVRSYRSLSGPNHTAKGSHIWVSFLPLIAFAFWPGDGPFCAWPLVNAPVVLRMLVFPSIGVYFLASGFRRMVADNDRRGFPPKVFIPLTSMTLFLCLGLLVTAGALADICMVIGNLQTGQSHSPFGSGRVIYLHRSPEAYWTYTEVFVFFGLMILTIGLVAAIGQILEILKRRDNPLGQIVSFGVSLSFAVMLFIVGRYLFLMS